MTRTLVAQAESSRSFGTGGHRFGYEIFDVDGEFRLVIHTQTYDGIRRASHWATPEKPLATPTKETAIEEATRLTVAYAKAVTGADA